MGSLPNISIKKKYKEVTSDVCLHSLDVRPGEKTPVFLEAQESFFSFFPSFQY